jgi:hypothetical protein
MYQPTMGNPGMQMGPIPFYPQIPMHPTLNIYGAFYGTGDVSDKVAKSVVNNSLSICASNAVFGDPLYKVRKTLVVFYSYGSNTTIFSAVAMENEFITINYLPSIHNAPQVPIQSLPAILGAIYGVKNVTPEVAMLTAKGTKSIPASNQLLGDGLYGIKKTLCVLYVDSKSATQRQATTEGNSIVII